MIDLTELRIGNWITVGKSNPIQITGIFNEYIRALVLFPVHDDVNPIPLTPEWLERFGFSEKYHSAGNHWTRKAKSVNAGCVLIDPEDEETEKLKGIFYYSNWGIDILYVHQLQNLYFALTGEEL